MNKDDSLNVLSDLSTIIGMLEHKWERPHSVVDAGIMQTLLSVRETVRKAHEAAQSKEQRMNDPKVHPDFQSAWPDLFHGEEVAIPLTWKIGFMELTPEQEQIISRFYGEMLAKMTPETAVKKLRGIWSANREVLKNDDLAWLAMIADWIEAQQSK